VAGLRREVAEKQQQQEPPIVAAERAPPPPPLGLLAPVASPARARGGSEEASTSPDDFNAPLPLPLLLPTEMVRSGRAPRRRPPTPPPPQAVAVAAAPPPPPRRQEKQQPRRKEQPAPPAPITPTHLTRRSWPLAAKRCFPRLYDPSWHASLYGFLLDLWAEAGAAHERGDEAALARAYAFANAALSGGGGGPSSPSAASAPAEAATPPAPPRSARRPALPSPRPDDNPTPPEKSDDYTRVSALLSLADALADSDALLEAAWPRLADKRLARAALVPAVRALRGRAAALEAAAALLRAAGGDEGERDDSSAALIADAPLPPKLARVLDQLRALSPLYPGVGSVGALTAVAPAHGVLLD
jgi:hypothetical protein